MNHSKAAEDLVSWLKYLDIEYLDDEISRELSKLDINDHGDQRRVIEKAIAPEFSRLNEISKESLKRILAAGTALTNSDTDSIFSRVGMPFPDELVDRQGFLREVWHTLFPGESLPGPGAVMPRR